MDNTSTFLLALLCVVVAFPVSVWILTSHEAPTSYAGNARRTCEYLVTLITVLLVLDTASDLPLRSDFLALSIGGTFLVIALDWLMLVPDGRRAAL